MLDPTLAEFLAEAQTEAKTKPLSLTVRELIDKWGAKRRGYLIVGQIRNDLQSYGLTTDPDFDETWIDETVDLVESNSSPELPADAAAQSSTTGGGAPGEIYLRVNSIDSANVNLTKSKLISVSPQDSIPKAQSLMMRHDFSQLPVLSGERDLRGAVSWESIAQARILKADVTLADAIAPAEVIRPEDDLLSLIPRIVAAGFVFVQARDKRIVGIVTAGDLGGEIAKRANPFFMLAEIESHLRGIIDDKFSGDELAAAVSPENAGPSIKSADDLTFGGYKQLLENPANWDRLVLDLDRKSFIEALEDVRLIRNDVMHFSPDPLDDIQVAKLSRFAQWLRKIRPSEST